MSPENLPTVGQWFSQNIGFLVGMIIGISFIIFLIWTFIDKEKKSGFWRKLLTSLTVGFFITVGYFIYKVVIMGLERL